MGKPEIRFKGYTDEWEQRKLSELSDFITKGATPTTYGYDWQESGIPFFRNDAIKDNQFIYGDFSYISEEANEALQRSEIHGDDILVAITGDIGKAGIVPKSIEKGNINQHTARVRIIKDAIPYFVYQSLITDEQQKKYQLIKTGLSMPQLSLQQIRDTSVLCPSVEEQSMIGECFINLDNLITLHQRKCDEVKSLKKYMLQKMFPQNEQKVPEIRFEGFTEVWEQRKLGDWGNFYYGRSCPKWSVTEDATIPCIRYGELYTKFGAKIDRVYSYTNMPPENLRFSKGTEVLIPRVGEDPMDYNHCTWLSMQDVAIGEMISVFNTDNNPLFTATMFNATLQNEFAMRVEGGSVTNLYFEKLKNIDVSFPSIPEQEKIAAYFENLDHLITLHQQKCEELKKIKKFMLQKMFV